MPFKAWIAVVALVVVTTYAAFGLLDAEPVPVASVVELSGTAPQPRPPSDGFLIVPPQVVDFSDSGGDNQAGADDSPDDDGPDDDVDDSPDDDGLDDDVDDGLDDDGLDDDSPDDSPDDD